MAGRFLTDRGEVSIPIVFAAAVALAVGLIWLVQPNFLTMGRVPRTSSGDARAPNQTAGREDIVYVPDTSRVIVDLFGRKSASGELPTPASPWVAIIIDDLGPGHTDQIVDEFLSLPYDLTFAIIPGNPHSVEIGMAVEDAGAEQIIHLPMEPTQPNWMNERDMVFADADSEALHEVLDRVTHELPDATGLNNHMGSRATANDRLMKMLARELKRHGLVFIDSRTTGHSAAVPAMRAAGVAAISRDVFLDYELDSRIVGEGIDKLVEIARRRGWAVGIGHARRATLDVLAGRLPYWDEFGVRFVSVGRLIESLSLVQWLESGVLGSFADINQP